MLDFLLKTLPELCTFYRPVSSLDTLDVTNLRYFKLGAKRGYVTSSFLQFEYFEYYKSRSDYIYNKYYVRISYDVFTSTTGEYAQLSDKYFSR